MWFRKVWVKIVMWALVALVMFTRLYLGVHTPFDVVAGFLVSFVLILMIGAIFEKLYADRKYDPIVSGVLAAVSIAAIVFALVVKKLHPEVEQKMVTDCLKASSCGIGFAVGYFVERRFINFDPKCGSVGDKILRVILGVGGVFAIKEGLKWLGKLIFKAELPAVDVARYLLIVLFGMCLVPLIVKKIHGHDHDNRQKEGRKNKRKQRNKMKKRSRKANAGK